jgi:hypothetical protein
MAVIKKPIEIEKFDSYLRRLIKKRLKNAPSEIKKSFPAVLNSQKIEYFSALDDKCFLIIFVDAKDKARIDSMVQRGRYPFPGLISYDSHMPSFFVLGKSQNIYIKNCTVSNAFSFVYGPDSTVVLQDHHQMIDIKDQGPYEYSIKLAYLITFGEEIAQENIIKSLDELITFSITQWRKNNAGI